MNKLLNKAIRPLAALTAVGALAAVAAFALLAMPGSQPAEAAIQTVAGGTAESRVGGDATANSLTLRVSNADLETGDFLFLDFSGYRALGTRTWINPDNNANPDDETSLDSRRACTVAVMVGSDNRVGPTSTGGGDDGDSPVPNGEFGCRSDASGILAYASVVSTDTAVTSYTVIVTDIERTGTEVARGTLTLRENSGSDSINYDDFVPGATVTNLEEIGYGPDTTPPTTGLWFRLPASAANAVDEVSINSTTASASIQIQATIHRLPMDLESGSSIVLYLEDDYEVPETIALNHVWFTLGGVPNTGGASEADDGRHHPTEIIEIDTDDYPIVGSDATHIQVFIPDVYPGSSDTEGIRGFQHPLAGEELTLTLHKNSGIKNPSEAGTHSVAYAVLGPEDPDVTDPQRALKDEDGLDPATFAKIGLSDDDDARGKSVTVTGSGFNNGVSATLRMKHYPSAGRYTVTDGVVSLASEGDPNAAIADAGAVAANREEARRNNALDSFTLAVGDIMTQAQTCTDIVVNGTELGSGNNIVGSDDRVQITFTVSNPPFGPGDNNLLCMVDGERTASSGDVEHFHLDPSIRVVPDTVSAGQQVTVFAEDYPEGAAFQWVEVLGSRVDHKNPTSITASGKGSVQFDMPGNRKGTIKVEACWGGTSATTCDKESTNISVAPSQLTASKLEVRANESIIIRGSGFSEDTGSVPDLDSAKIGEAELKVASDGGNLEAVEVSNSGQFSATFAVWSEADNNPALQPGKHKIVITDVDGFTGEVEITIARPTISITPEVAGPRDYVVISGANWPVENDDGGDVEDVNITVSGGGIKGEGDKMNESADANGNWSVRYRVPGDVNIPGTVNVKAAYGDTEDIVEITQFRVPQANLQISPATVVPGGDLTLSASGFSLYESQIDVKIGNVDVAVPTGTSTDREGALEDLTVKVPSLDAATYTVQLQVGGSGGTVAIGEVIILADDEGGEAELPGALDPLGDNLVRVFHFNNATKTWSFYDPRPEFTELNTLSALAAGEPYWILVGSDQSVTLNARAHEMTCQGGDCWNSLVW